MMTQISLQLNAADILLGGIIDTLLLGVHFSRDPMVTIIRWAVDERSGSDFIRACVPRTGK